MMKLFSVRDLKGETFGAPMSIRTEGIAKRSFVDACQQKDSDLNRYPADYILYEIGTYNPDSGKVKGHDTPIHVLTGVEAKSIFESERKVVEPVLPGVEA